jgi:four helix bundle protein
MLQRAFGSSWIALKKRRNSICNLRGTRRLKATSTAAHYRAVCRAKSRADFTNKLSGAIEEVDESALWLEILSEAGICASSKTSPLWREADELTRIFVRSRETARANQKAAMQQAESRRESKIKNQQSTTNQ